MGDLTSPRKVQAIELYALQPSITAKEVANSLGVSFRTVEHWRTDPNFIEAINERHNIVVSSEIPAVINAMLREAKSGNVQAAKLVLEFMGKLVKNINVTVDSPFERWMKKVEVEDVVDGEIESPIELVEEIPEEVVDMSNLPERVVEDQNMRAKKEKQSVRKAILDEKKKAKYNNQRREWYRWKKRAKAVGVEPLAAKRPTKGQRIAWQEKIERKERGEEEN